MIIEDRLSFDDAPTPPRPAPAPVAPVTPIADLVDVLKPSNAARSQTIVQAMNFAVVVALTGVILWQHFKGQSPPTPAPTPSPAVDATKDGAAWAKELSITFADSFAQAQADVKGTDKSLSAIRKDHVERWAKARDAAFNARFVPLLDQVIAPGNDKPTMEDRRRYAEVMGQIVTGVREASK